MGECCDGHGYQETFGEGFARRMSRRYHQRGLSRTQQRLVDFLAERGLEGATVLEIGGGIGEIQVELLRRGAASATNLEISENYEAEAADLLRETGLAGRVSRRFHDIATSPDEVEPADIVVLHRVVCCYPDYEKLLGAAAGHARRMLVFSHPPRNLLSPASVMAWTTGCVAPRATTSGTSYTRLPRWSTRSGPGPDARSTATAASHGTWSASPADFRWSSSASERSSRSRRRPCTP